MILQTTWSDGGVLEGFHASACVQIWLLLLSSRRAFAQFLFNYHQVTACLQDLETDMRIHSNEANQPWTERGEQIWISELILLGV